MAATMSVVHFGVDQKILQQACTNVAATTAGEGAGGRREIIILRKPPHILPQPIKEEPGAVGRKKKAAPAGGGSIRTAPQPVAVARRNARERNRVKQVNNGFANLRQHIPNFIASAFESSSSRGGSKKLSKVETLRMAVEYIRSLEDILAMEPSSSEPSASPASHSLSDTTSNFDDTIPNNFIPGQYYSIIPSHLVYSDDNTENLEPLLDPAELMAFRGVQDLSLLENMGRLGVMGTVGGMVDMGGIPGSDSLSPSIYSEQSLSPVGMMAETGGAGAMAVQFVIKQEQQEVPVISVKTEQELPQDHKGDVMDVMQWWEQQGSPQKTVS